jgi:hypothetical protein
MITTNWKKTITLVLLVATVLSSNVMGFAQNNTCLEQDNVCRRRKDCETTENNKPQIVTSKRCERFLEYYNDLYLASQKYSTPTLKLTPSVLAAIIDRESMWLYALKPNVCDGVGDKGWGHGLVQIDGYYSTPFLGRYGKKNTPVIKKTNKYGQERFNWSSCNESIRYIGAYFMSLEDSSSTKAFNKLKQAGLNLARNDDKSFKDPKVQSAYLQLMINAYNAGPRGTFEYNTCSVNNQAIVSDGCTTGKNYATNVLTRAKDFEKFETTSKIVSMYQAIKN